MPITIATGVTPPAVRARRRVHVRPLIAATAVAGLILAELITIGLALSWSLVYSLSLPSWLVLGTGAVEIALAIGLAAIVFVHAFRLEQRFDEGLDNEIMN